MSRNTSAGSLGARLDQRQASAGPDAFEVQRHVLAVLGTGTAPLPGVEREPTPGAVHDGAAGVWDGPIPCPRTATSQAVAAPSPVARPRRPSVPKGTARSGDT